MTSKQAAVSLLTYALPIILFGGSARAAITLVRCTDYLYRPLEPETWTIDYDLQILSLTIPVYETGSNPPDSPPPYFVGIYGIQGSQSVLTMVEHIANNTGVPLTDCTIDLSSTVGTHSEFVLGTVQATGSAQVRSEDSYQIELAWPEPISAGGVFTIQFEVLNLPVSDDWIAFTLNHTVVPEPATIIMLALGGLAGRRLRRMP